MNDNKKEYLIDVDGRKGRVKSEDFENNLDQFIEELPQARIAVTSPDGTKGSVPLSNYKNAISKGYAAIFAQEPTQEKSQALPSEPQALTRHLDMTNNEVVKQTMKEDSSKKIGELAANLPRVPVIPGQSPLDYAEKVAAINDRIEEENIEKFEQQQQINALPVSKEEIDNKIKEIDQQLRDDFDEQLPPVHSPEGMTYMDMSRLFNPKKRNLSPEQIKQKNELEQQRKALQLQHKFLDSIQEYQKYDQKGDQSGIKRLLGGLAVKGDLQDFATWGISEINRDLDFAGILGKAARGEQLTLDESKAVRLYENLQQIASIDRGSYFNAGAGFQQSFELMRDMLLASMGGGISTIGRLGIKEAIKSASKQMLKKSLQNIYKVPLMPSFYRNVAKANVENYSIKNYGTEQKPVWGVDTTNPASKLLYREWAKQYTEVLTEILGGAFESIGMLNRIAKKASKAGGIIGKGARLYDRIHNTTIHNSVGKYIVDGLDKMGLQSFPMEFVEEIANVPLQSMLLGDSSEMDKLIYDKEARVSFLQEVAISTAALAGVGGAVNVAAGGASAMIERRKSDKAINNYTQSIKDAIDNIDNASHKTALLDLLSDLEKANYYDNNGEFDGSQILEDLSRVKDFEGDSQTYKKVESLVKEKLYREGQTQALKAIMEDEVGEIEYGTSGDVVAALDKDGAFLFILGETDDTYLVSNPQTKEQKVISKGDIERYGETKSVDRAVTDYYVNKSSYAGQQPMPDMSQVQQTASEVASQTEQTNAPLQKGDKATYDGTTVTVDDLFQDNDGNTVAIITDENNNSHNVPLADLQKLNPILTKDRYILPDGKRAVINRGDGYNTILDVIDDNNNIIENITVPTEELSTYDKVPAQQANAIEGLTENVEPKQELDLQSEQEEKAPQQNELPRDKDGNIDFDTLLESDPQVFVQEYSKVVGEDTALEQLSEVAQEIDKQIQSKEKEIKKSASFNKKASLAQEVKQLQNRRNALTSQILKMTQFAQESVEEKPTQSEQEDIISQKWNQSQKVQGNSDTRILPDGSQLKGHWVLAEADAPTPSHDPHTLSPSEGFPTTSEGKNINDNDYSKKSAEVKVMAANYDGRAIDNPIFVKNGVVISGNNRTMSGILAAESGTDSKYLQALQQKAPSLGFTAQQIASMKHPRVFFEVEDDIPMTTETFAKFNQRETKSKTPTERAIVASKRDNSRLIGLILSEVDKYEKLSDVYQNANSTAAIVRYMTEIGLINNNEVAELYENGSFTANGKDFLESLLVGSTIKEDQIKILNTEGMKTLRAKVVKSIIPLVENSKLRKENQILDDINQAILYLYQAKVAKLSLEEFIRQNDMFDKKLFDEDAVFVALKLQQSEKEFRSFVEQVNARLSSETPSMFTGELETKQDIYGEFEQQLSDAERRAIESARTSNALNQERAVSTDGSGPISRREELDGVLKEPESEDQIKPIGVGVFGNIYNQFKGQAKAAIAFLKKRKEGEAIGALSHPKVGDISLVWGNPKAGLEKILSKHSEVLNVLQEVIHDMKVVQKSDNRIKLESPTHFAVVSKEWMGKPREQWLLTACEKKQMSVSGGSMDINPEPFGKQNDTAPLQNAHLSESKVSKPASDIQQKSTQTVLEKAQNNAINNEIDSQAQQTNTSPSQAQKEAGNYKMGHVKVQGLNISIENPAGSIRSGVDPNGQKWSITMNNHYGYIRGTKGKDKDHIDVFLGNDQLSDKVYVIDQVNSDGSFDEHKVMIGFDSAQQAKDAYMSNYSDGWTGFGNITEITMREFKSWVNDGARKVKPFAEYRAHSLENIKQQAADYSRKYGTTVEVIESAEDIENPIARMAAQQYGIFGWYDINSKKVFVYAPNMINRPSELEKTILHEVVAHKGLRELLGDIAFNKLCDDVWEMMSEADKRKWAAYAMRVSEGDVDLNEVNAGLKVKREAADEFMASFAEDGIKNQSIWQRIKEAVLNALRAMGIDIQLTDADIAYMLYRSSKALEKNTTIKEKADAKIKAEQIEMNLSDEAAAKEKGFEEPLRLRFIGTKGASILDQQVDKKKVSDWLNTADLDSPIRIDNPKLLSVTKLINDFENPTISPENSSEVRFKVNSLIGLHNISENKLRKAIKQGGLANPSVAVIDIDKQSHEGYGEISLLMPKTLVDKKAGRNAGTFLADAWTPVYPNIQKQISNKGSKEYRKAIAGLDTPLKNKIALYFENYLDSGVVYDALFYWYALDRGLNPALVTNDLGDFTQQQIDNIKAVSEDGKSFWSLPEASRQALIDQYKEKEGGVEAYNEKIKGIVEKLKSNIDNVQGLRKKMLQEKIQEYEEYGVSISSVADYYNKALRVIDNFGKVSEYATFYNALKYVNDNNLRSDVDRWLSEKEEQFDVKEMLYAGTDNQGRQKWIPNTLENASKLMNRQGVAGAQGGASFNHFIAMAAPKATSLKQIKAKQGNLSDDNEYQKFRQKWEDIYQDLALELQPGADPWDDYGQWRLEEMLTVSNPKAFIKKEYGIELSEGFMTKFNNLVGAIKNDFPARYFELKFTRPVMLDEFTAAVVPDNVGDDIRQALINAGLNIATYENGNNEQRKDLINQLSDDSIRFRYKTSSGKNVNFTQLSLFDQNEETSQDETLLGRKLRPLQQGEFCHVERVFAKSKAFDFTSAEKIESSDDVAYIFSQLEDESVENSFAVLVKDGKPYVLHLGMGDFSQTVFNIAAIKAADNLIKADDIYMVHNHPSGNLRASSNDMNMLSRMRQAFGNRLKDGIIINLKTGKYGTFTELGLDDQRQKATPKESYPVEMYSFSKQVFDYDYDPANLMQINSSIDAASFISGHRLGDRAKISLLIFNRQSKVVGNILTPFSMNALDEKKKLQLAEQIVDYVIKMGGEVAIAYGSGIDVNNAKQRKDIGEISRRVQSFSGYTVSIVDWIYVEGNAQKYVSAAEEGIRLRRVTEQEYDSYQQRLDEVDSQITDIDNIPQEVIEQREKIFNEYLSNITNEPYSIISRHNYKEVMQENGVDGQIIQAVEAVYSNPENVSPGMYTDGRIYFFADKISSIENLRLTLIHERQHRITDENWEKYSNDVISRVENIEELRDVVEKLSGGDYSDADWGELVSEFYSFAMMYVYTGKNYPQRFKSLGINDELIDLIKQLDYEQQQNNDYIDSRRGTARNEALHGTNLGSDSQDVRDSLQGTTQMGEQRQRPAQGGQRGTQDTEGDISSTNQQADESERNNNNTNSRGRQIQVLNSEYEQLGVNSQDVRYPRQGSSELGEQRGRFEVPGQEGTQGAAGSIDKGNQVRLRYTPIFQSNAERALLDIEQALFRRALDGDVITADKIAAKGLKATLGDDSYNRMIGEIFDILPLMDKAAYSKRGLSKESVVASMVDRIANDIPGNMDDLLMVLSIVKDSLNEKSLAILPDNTDLLLQLWKETSLPEAVTIKEKLSNLAKVNQIRLRAEKDMPPATNDVKLTRRQVWEERLQDRMISVKIFYDELAKIGVKPSMDMNSYVTENLALSRSQSEDYQFKQDIYRPLIQEVTQVESLFKELGLAKDNEQAYKLVNDYLYARHAKERNKQICCEEIVEKMMYKIFKNERTLFKDNIRNALMNLASRMYNERKPNHTAPVTSSTFAKNLLKTKGDTAQEQKLLESFRKRFVEIVDQAQEDMDKIFSSKNGTNRSGMTDAQSEEILKNLYTDSTKKQLEKLSDMVRKSTHFTIDTWEKYSLIDKQTAENMKKMYEYYIPLRGWEVTEDVDYSQLPNQAFNKASQIITANKKAQGRTSKADDPLTYIASLAQTAIVTGNKNMIRLNLYRLIKANQGNKALEAYATLPKLFYVEMPGSETAIVTDERPSQELFDQGLVKTKSNKAYHWHKSHAEYDAHIVPVMVNGTRQMIELRGELGIKVAAAINNTNVLHWQAAEALKPVTNWLSSIRTSYNPEFILLNFIRDFMFANMAYGIEGGDTKELDKNLLKAFRSIHYLQSGKPVDSKWDVYYTEFLENGGQTGFFTMQNIDAMKRELATMHSKMLRGKQIVSRGKKIAEYCNAMSESAMRLAVFITEREKGTSAKEAAYKAHEISVNFNRKGTWSGVFGGFYSFFNASVQGTARLFQVLGSNKKKAAATVGTIALAKLASAVIAAAVGGDDYKELSDYVKFSNIVIPIGKDGKGKTIFFLIPMAQGLRAITNIADNIVEAMIGNKSVFEAGKTTLLNVIGEFLPLSFDAIDLTGKQTLYSYATVVAPTVIQPMLDVWVNQDFKGEPIYKRPYLASQEGFIPEYKNVYGNVSPWFVGGSKILNRLGGGDDLRSASVWVDKQGNVKESPFGYYFDVNPAKVEHLLNGYLGGIFSFPTNFFKTIYGALDDQPGVNLYNIPLAGRFVRKSYQMDGYADYFAIRDYVQTIKMSISAANKAGDIQSAMTIQKRNAKLLNAYKVYEDRVKQLKEHLNNDEISAQKRDELNRKMDELILQAAQDLNQINNETDSRD